MAIQEWQKSLLRNWLTMHGVKEADADRFVSDPAVQAYARKAVAGEVPAPTDKQIAEYYSKGAKTGADPLTLFAADIAPKSPAAAASPATPAEVPQPVAPTQTMAGGAPSPLGPLPPGTSIMEPPSGPLPRGIDIMGSEAIASTQAPFGMELSRPPQIDLAPDMGMAGFQQGGSGINGYRPVYTLTDKDISDRLVNKVAGEIKPGNAESASGTINNMFNRIGAKGYGPADTLYDVAFSGEGTKHEQYTGYRKASPEEAQMIRDQIKAVASGSVPDPTNGATDYRAHSYLQGDGKGKTAERMATAQGYLNIGGNVYFKDKGSNVGPYAANGSGADPFANVELQDAGVTPASWLSGGEYRQLGDGTPAPAPETLPTAPPPPSASDPFAGNVEPPPFTKGPTAAPPPSAPALGAPVLGGGVGYDTLPPSADPSMLQRPLEPQLGPLQPPVLGAPVLGGAGGNFMPPQGSSDTLGTAYGAPVLGGMGGDLASGDGSLGPLIDPSMPLPTRAPTPPIVGMPMPLQSMAQAPLEPQLPTSPMSIPTRSTYSSNMSPIDQPPMSPFNPAAAPPLGAPSYDMANTFDPSLSQYDMANQFSPTQPPPATPQYDMANQFSPATPQYDMANQFSPAPTPPAQAQSFFEGGGYRPLTPPPTPQYDMANTFSPSTPQFDMANTFTPTPSGGPPGTVPSSTDPNTYVPPGFGVASAAGFNPIAPPSATGNPFLYQPEPPTSPTPTPSQGFDPTQGAPGVGSVPAMPSWAIPGAFGMPGASGGNIGGISPMQYAGGTSVPTSMASSTGAYTGLGTNPATLGIPGMTSPMLGMTGPGPQPGMTDWSKTGRLTGGIGGGPISEGASPAPAGNAASSASMEAHALQLMAADHAAGLANAMRPMASSLPMGSSPPPLISGSQVMGLVSMPTPPKPSSYQPSLPIFRPPLLNYGMNVGLGSSFGSRF